MRAGADSPTRRASGPLQRTAPGLGGGSLLLKAEILKKGNGGLVALPPKAGMMVKK